MSTAAPPRTSHPSRPSRPSSAPVAVRIARWSATHAWRAIGLWLVFVAACVAIGSVSGLHEATALDQSTGQSGRALHWLHDSGLLTPQTENVLVTARSGTLSGTQARAALTDAVARMRALPQVASVGTPVASKDAQAMTVQVTLRHDADVQPLLGATRAVQATYPGLRVEQVGAASMGDAVNDLVSADLGRASSFSLPVTLVILLVAFGAIIAAGAPVLLALSAVASATGLSALASHVVPDSGSTSSMILLMGMAVGVDYSLFYVKRARSERHAGRTQLDAVEIAAETSGHSVLVSGVAVIVSMLGLYLTGNVIFESLATGSIIVVAVAVLGSLTVLPALLVKLGRAIDRPRVPLLWRLTSQTREPRLWPALLRPSLNRPGRTLVVSVLVLGALALPALGLTLHSDSTQSLPASLAEKQTADRLSAAFPGEQATQRIVVRAPAAQAAAVTNRLTALGARIGDGSLFLRDTHPVIASADRTVHALDVDAPFDAESHRARDGVALLRSTLVPRAIDGVPGARWAVGGDTADNVDADTHLADRLPWVVGFVVLLTMLIMGWVFRSVVIAVATAAMNLLSAGVAFGVLALTFQHTWAEGLLGFRSTGAVINWIPLFTFAVLFGLSMDYHVFVLGHIREAARSGMPMRAAISTGITRSAGTVTSAAVVMVSVFSIFASLHLVEMKELGVTLAVAVLVDALVVRVIVLPALLMLIGKRLWQQPVSRGRAQASPSDIGPYTTFSPSSSVAWATPASASSRQVSPSQLSASD